MTKDKNKLDPDFIRQLAELVQETDLTEIEVEQDDLRIRVAREIVVQQAAIAAPVAAAPAPVAAPAPAAAALPQHQPLTLRSPALFALLWLAPLISLQSRALQPS